MRDTRFLALVYDKQHDFKIENSVNRTPVKIHQKNLLLIWSGLKNTKPYFLADSHYLRSGLNTQLHMTPLITLALEAQRFIIQPTALSMRHSIDISEIKKLQH